MTQASSDWGVTGTLTRLLLGVLSVQAASYASVYLDLKPNLSEYYFHTKHKKMDALCLYVAYIYRPEQCETSFDHRNSGVQAVGEGRGFCRI